MNNEDTRVKVPGLVVPKEMLPEIRLVYKKISLAKEALNATGKDPGFYTGALSLLAESEDAKEAWESKFAEILGQPLPSGSGFDISTGEVYVASREST